MLIFDKTYDEMTNFASAAANQAFKIPVKDLKSLAKDGGPVFI